MKSRYLFIAILIAAGLAWLLRANGQQILNVPPTLPENSTIELIGTKELERRFSELKDKRGTLLFIYTSWCPYCKRQLPIMRELAREKKLPVNIIGLSVDQDGKALASYLSQNKKLNFPNYLFDRKGNLNGLLNSNGGHYNGGIPYMAVIDNKGHIVSEFMGLTSGALIEKEIYALPK